MAGLWHVRAGLTHGTSRNLAVGGYGRVIEQVSTSPDEFLASLVPARRRSEMLALDQVITTALPGRSRTLWEGVFWGGTDQRIIGYGDLVQPRPRGRSVEWFLVGLASQKHHMSIYVNAVRDGRYLVSDYADRLGAVKVGSANIALRRLEGVDMEALSEMIALAGELHPPDQSEV